MVLIQTYCTSMSLEVLVGLLTKLVLSNETELAERLLHKKVPLEELSLQLWVLVW
jgi:Na+-transporting NADH:ubiquinone oxidoreductase subunit NqrA